MNSEGNRYHVCQAHIVSSTLLINEKRALSFKAFPCSYPVLSFWLLLLNTMRKVDGKQRIRVITDNVSPIWEHVANYLGELMSLKFGKTNDERCIVILITSGSLGKVSSSENDVYVISEADVNVRNDSSANIKHIGVFASLTGEYKIQKLIERFRTWLQTLDHTLLFFEDLMPKSKVIMR